MPFGFFPDLIVATKVFSLYPRDGSPVAVSGVRFDATVCPHGPHQAVRSSDVWISPSALVGIFVVDGRPDSSRAGSGVMPWLFGEWQSWHPVMLTRYLPRSTDAPAAPAAAPRCCACPLLAAISKSARTPAAEPHNQRLRP